MTREVNERQREILAWVAEGCPERVWPDETHKHSARALQSRGLVKVYRLDGVWAARLTDAGRHFVAHGAYPVEQVAPPPRQRRHPASIAASRARGQTPDLAEPSEPLVLRPPAPTAAQRLCLRLLSAGGRLQIETAVDAEAAAELQKCGLVPVDKVVRSGGRGWQHEVLYLDDDPQTVVGRREVGVPQRLAKPHPLATLYQQDHDVHEVSRGHLARATRIVHALATAFDAADLHVELRPGRAEGQFHVGSGRWGVSIRLSEKAAPGSDQVPYYDPRRGQKLPAWQSRRQKQFISTGTLTIVVGGPYSGHGRQYRFSDGRSRQLEAVLPDVVREVEMRLLEGAQHDRETEREDQELQQRWERVLDAAQERAEQAYRADVLASRAQRWRDWQDQRAYLDDLQATVLRRGIQDDAVRAWVEWSHAHLAATDPAKCDHGMPSIPAPTREFVQPHLRGWVVQPRAFRA